MWSDNTTFDRDADFNRFVAEAYFRIPDSYADYRLNVYKVFGQWDAIVGNVHSFYAACQKKPSLN